MLEYLQRPFPAEKIKTRPVGGGSAEYIEVGAVVERLNRAALSWDFTIERSSWETLSLPRTVGNKRQLVDVPVYIVLGRLTLPGLGSRVGRGVQAMDPGAGEDLLKGADSDALKRAAELFGVPLDGGRNRGKDRT